MNQDAERLRLLSIFHYVVAGAAAFCSFFPLIYTAVGFVFVALSRHPPTNPSQQPPPAALGWALVGVGIFLFLLGAVFALVLAFAGRSPSGSLSLWRVSSASSFPLGQFSACLRLSCFRANP